MEKKSGSISEFIHTTLKLLLTYRFWTFMKIFGSEKLGWSAGDMAK